MNKFLNVVASVLVAGISCSAMAAIPSGATPPTGPSGAMSAGQGYQGGQGGQGGGNHPCKAIMEACKSAGFVKGEASTGKGIMKDCMMPLMKGQTVSGVNVSSGEIQACQAKMAERKEHHQGSGQGMGQTQQPMQH